MLQISTLSSLPVTGHFLLRPDPEHDRGCIIAPQQPVSESLNFAAPAAKAFSEGRQEARSRTTRGRALSRLRRAELRGLLRPGAAGGRSGRAAAARHRPQRPRPARRWRGPVSAGTARASVEVGPGGLCPGPAAARVSPLLAGAAFPERYGVLQRRHAFPALLTG